MINLSFFLICYLISTEDTVPEVSKKILQYGHTQHQGLLFSLRIENSEWESSQKKKKTQQINKIISGDSSTVLRAKKKVSLCLMQENFTHLLSEPFQVLTVAGVCYMPAGIKHEYFGHLPKNYMPGYWKFQVSHLAAQVSQHFFPSSHHFVSKRNRNGRMEASMVLAKSEWVISICLGPHMVPIA